MTALPVYLGDPAPTCRECGCSDFDACTPPCWWSEPDLCSSCADPRDEPLEGGSGG